MQNLLNQYFNIAFLMGKPQDLPGSYQVMKVGVMLAFVTYVLALSVPYGLQRALIQVVIDLSSTAFVFYIALLAVGKQTRFQQAFGGLCGASAFINAVALPLYMFRTENNAAQGVSIAQVADFVLLVWGLSLLGHIIRHTFEVGMFLSIALSFTYFIYLSSLVTAVLPVSVVTEDQISVLDFDSLFAAYHWMGHRLSG